MIGGTQPTCHGVSLTCVGLEYTLKPHGRNAKQTHLQ